jgi:putative oxidoreductase
VLSMFIVFLVRALLVVLFLPFSALDKILNFKQALDQASQAVSARSLGTILIFAGFGVEVVCRSRS